MAQPLRIMVVDDEALARLRLVSLLARIEPPVAVVAEAGGAHEAWAWWQAHASEVDVLLLDVQMPGVDGLQLAARLKAENPGTPPQVVFVTAHADHALRAFELDARDYLTKPVRLERLADALDRCRRTQVGVSTDAAPMPPPMPSAPVVLLVQERGALRQLPVSQVLYLKAEQKYVTARTARHSHVLDESLTDLEGRLGPAFVRVHRNALVARSAMCSLQRRDDPQGGEGWAVQVKVTGEWLSVSRRQVAVVREELARPTRPPPRA